MPLGKTRVFDGSAAQGAARKKESRCMTRSFALGHGPSPGGARTAAFTSAEFSYPKGDSGVMK